MAKSIKRSPALSFRNLIFLFLLLFLPLVVFVASNPQLYENRSKAVQIEGDGGTSCYADRILEEYKITITGVSSCVMKSWILSAYEKAHSFPGFQDKIGKEPIRFENRTSQSSNWAYTSSSNTIKLNNFHQGSESKWKFIITHELMHLVQHRKNILSQYPYSSLVKNDNNCFRSTTNGFVIRTYANQAPSNPVHESLAESGALFVLDKSPFNSSIGSFKRDCRGSFSWFKDNLFY